MKPYFNPILLVALLSLSALNLQLSTALAQGSLTPPGAPAPTMKTLEQVEPRTPISTLPFTIDQPGSYYLTANLTGNVDGITIQASNVTLDLMGFELCHGDGEGILVSVTCTNLAIRNGTVHNWTGSGIDAGSAFNSQFEALRLSNNGGHGLNTASGSTINKCTAQSNAGDGIRAGEASSIYGCTVSFNGGDGIVCGSGGSVRNCSARNNTGNGFMANPGSTLSGCSAHGNMSNGIFIGEGSTITGCSARFNAGDGIVSGFGCTISDCTAHRNTGDGIEVASNCTVRNNNCAFNGNTGDGAGIHATGSANRIEGNTVTSNDRGIDVDDEPNLIIRNAARGNGNFNYVITVGNRVGVLVLPPLSGDISGDTDADAAGAGTTDPWANFSF